MAVDIQRNPALCGAVGDQALLQRIDAGILVIDQRGVLAGRPGHGEIAVQRRVQTVGGQRIQIDIGHVGRHRLQPRVDRHLFQRRQLAGPEAVEIRRLGRRGDLFRRHSGTHRHLVQFARHGRGGGRGRADEAQPRIDHAGMIQRHRQGTDAAGQVDYARLQHREIVLTDFVTVFGIARAQQGMDGPAHRLADLVDAGLVERLEDQVYVGQALRGSRKRQRKQRNKKCLFHTVPA